MYLIIENTIVHLSDKTKIKTVVSAVRCVELYCQAERSHLEKKKMSSYILANSLTQSMHLLALGVRDGCCARRINWMWMIKHVSIKIPLLFQQTDTLWVCRLSDNLGVFSALKFVLFEKWNGTPTSRPVAMESRNSFLSYLNRWRCERPIPKRRFLCSPVWYLGTQLTLCGIQFLHGQCYVHLQRLILTQRRNHEMCTRQISKISSSTHSAFTSVLDTLSWSFPSSIRTFLKNLHHFLSCCTLIMSFHMPLINWRRISMGEVLRRTNFPKSLPLHINFAYE